MFGIKKRKEAVKPSSKKEIALSIGVGCIWFGSNGSSLKNATYFEDLRAALSAIESVTNLTIAGDDGKYGGVSGLYCEDEVFYFPHVYYARLEFDIYVPYKVQERLDAVCGTENLHVTIIHHYHLPVAYVTGPPSAFPLGNPSRGIVLFRKYLEEKFAEGATGLRCGCIGPSPFHADFFTLQDNQINGLKDVPAGQGYKTYLFGYSKSLSDGFEEFSDKYGNTFSLFYYLQNLRDKVLDCERVMANSTEELLKKPGNSRWIDRLKSSVASGKLIDRVNAASLEDQVYRSFIGDALAEAEENEPNEGLADLSYHFSELRRYGIQKPRSVVQDIVATFEKRRQGLLQNITVLIAGLAGGILGAILGSALTYYFTHSDRSIELQEPAIAPTRSAPLQGNVTVPRIENRSKSQSPQGSR